jgi:hypothetical protein|tara:strand:- start:2406 stop:3596 length:1191 start_codon:yes stop_codon:yes gene_type:complete
VKLTISSGSLGSKHHLLVDGEKFSWVDTLDRDSLLWGFDKPKDLKNATVAARSKISEVSDNMHSKFFNLIELKTEKLPWRSILPRDDYLNRLRAIVDQLSLFINDESNSYYITTHLRNRKLLWRLCRPVVNEKDLDVIIKQSTSPGMLSGLERFRPDKTGRARLSRYSLSSSITGRMTITSGPNILTLKRGHRKILRSRYPGGKIVEIDIRAAEPRVVLALMGKRVEGDVYTEIMRSIPGMIEDRSIAKIATLSAIYGASHHGLKSNLPKNVDASHVLDAVREYFRVRDIESVLRDQIDTHGYLINTHGRKVFSDEPSINHFVQSSAVDVAFDVFESAMTAFDKSNIRYCPVYYIHDAMMIDVHPDDLKSLKELCKNGFFSGKIGVNLPVKVEEIS